MHKNFIYQAFLVFVLAVALWYTGLAAYRYYTYSRLTAKTVASNSQWSVQEQSSEDYILETHYSFIVGNQTFEGQDIWDKESYRNRYSAEQYKKELSAQPLIVWYDPSQPAYSSLQKAFPFKECLTAIFVWGILLYFLWLGFYVSRFKH